MTDPDRPLLLGRALEATEDLARHLGSELVTVPEWRAVAGEPWSAEWSGPLAEWGRAVRTGRRSPSVVVCTWGAPSERVALADRSPDEWSASVEEELGRWFEATLAAARRCHDGGSLVVVAERPAALDAPGHGDTVIVAEGLATLARSLGIIEGDRGVRVNLVTTELWTAPASLLGLAPLLDTFPGTIGIEVAGAVRMLWSDDAAGVTGSVVRADCGRSW